jgi:hypothetical protein
VKTLKKNNFLQNEGAFLHLTKCDKLYPSWIGDRMFDTKSHPLLHAFRSGRLRASILLAPALLLGSMQAGAQHHDRFDQGVRYGTRGGHYDHGYDRGGYDHGHDRGYDRHQGGIGPGKGALIGGAGGAALGAIFGGGVKGALIGGAAGAGIGAIAGKAHQDNQRDRYGYRR